MTTSHKPLPIIALGLAVTTGCLTQEANALSFNLTDTTPGGMAADALAGFQQAVGIWESVISSNVTINLDIRFDNSLPSNVLGSTGSTTQGLLYSNVRTALLGGASSSDDLIATAGLPAGSSLSFLTNDANTSAVITDNNGSGNNTTLNVNTANAKALGLRAANDAATDGSIAFNSAFSWDFDQTDGVGAGLQDFVGVTVHEIGHALGFVSGVDTVDATHGSGPSAPTDLNNFRVHSVLDLFRYSSAGQLDYATGGNPYFSLDAGVTNLALFSTGSFNGDGRQASHWKDNLGLGIMDPTANPPGNANTLSALDLRAFDVIGFTIIPEPSSLSFGGLVALALVLHRRRR